MSFAAHRRHPHNETIAVRISGCHIALPSGEPGANAMVIEAATVKVERYGAN
jgi:hypothetical protein